MPIREEDPSVLDSVLSGAGNALGGGYVSGALTAGRDALQGNVGNLTDLKNSYTSGKNSYDQYSQQARNAHPYAEVVGGNLPAAAMLGQSASGGIRDALRGILNPAKPMSPVKGEIAKETAEAATPNLDDIFAKVKGMGTANPEANILNGAMKTYKDQGLYKQEAPRIAEWIGADKDKILGTLEKGAGVDPAEETLKRLMSLGK